MANSNKKNELGFSQRNLKNSEVHSLTSIDPQFANYSKMLKNLKENSMETSFMKSVKDDAFRKHIQMLDVNFLIFFYQKGKLYLFYKNFVIIKKETDSFTQDLFVEMTELLMKEKEQNRLLEEQNLKISQQISNLQQQNDMLQKKYDQSNKTSKFQSIDNKTNSLNDSSNGLDETANSSSRYIQKCQKWYILSLINSVKFLTYLGQINKHFMIIIKEFVNIKDNTMSKNSKKIIRSSAF